MHFNYTYDSFIAATSYEIVALYDLFLFLITYILQAVEVLYLYTFTRPVLLLCICIISVICYHYRASLNELIESFLCLLWKSFLSLLSELCTTAWKQLRITLAPFMAKYLVHFPQGRLEQFRSIFYASDIMIANAPGRLNPHAALNNIRVSARNFIKLFAQSINYTIYSPSMSLSEQRAKVAGSRLYYDERDLKQEVQNDDVPEDDTVISLIDVDYFLEEYEFHDYMKTGNPILMYTYVPETLTRDVEEHGYVSAFDNDARLLVSIPDGPSGGFCHHLWNWRSDTITFRSYNLFSFVTAHVHIKQIEDDRALVILIPYVHGGLLATLYFWMFPIRSTRLQRFDPRVPSRDGQNLFMQLPNRVCLSRLGLYVTVNLTLRQHAELVALNTSSPKSYEQSTLQITEDVDLIKTTKLFYANWITSNQMLAPVMDPTGSYTIVYYGVKPISDSKDRETVLMNPFINQNFTPSINIQNEVAIIEHRIQIPRSKDHVVPHKYYKYLDEFCDQLSAVVNVLYPFTREEIVEGATKKTYYDRVSNGFTFLRKFKKIDDLAKRLNKLGEYVDGKFVEGLRKIPWPYERVKLNSDPESQLDEHSKYLLDTARMLNKSFQKNEVYQEIKFPRNISAVDSAHVIQWLQYWLAVSKSMVAYTFWYAFGRDPAEYELLISSRFTDAEDLIETDFSKFDGTQGQFCRNIELAVLYRLFPKSEHDIIRSMAANLNWTRFRTTLNLKYNTQWSRLSGSGDTSPGNTIIAAFTDYCYNRECNLNPDEAYVKLGVFGGDDGVIRAFDDGTKYENVCKDLGFVVKAKLIKKRAQPKTSTSFATTDAPVTFLGRVFPDIWHSPASFYDPTRALGRLHVVPENVLPGKIKLTAINKMIGYYVTETGIMADLAKKVVDEIVEKDESLILENNLMIDEHSRFHGIKVNLCRSYKNLLTEYKDKKLYSPVDPSYILGYTAFKLGLVIGDLEKMLKDWTPFGTPIDIPDKQLIVPKVEGENVTVVANDQYILAKAMFAPQEVTANNRKCDLDKKEVPPYCSMLRKCNIKDTGCNLRHEVDEKSNHCIKFILGRCKKDCMSNEASKRKCKFLHTGFSVTKIPANYAEAVKAPGPPVAQTGAEKQTRTNNNTRKFPTAKSTLKPAQQKKSSKKYARKNHAKQPPEQRQSVATKKTGEKESRPKQGVQPPNKSQ